MDYPNIQISKQIIVTPYSPVSDQRNEKASHITIKNEIFSDIEEIEGQITFSFRNCAFLDTLVISNSDALAFQSISFQFVGCYFKEIEIEDIVTDNISFNFSSSIISGKISGDKTIIKTDFSNCIFENGLFLMSIHTIAISYQEEGIYPRIWNKLFKQMNSEYSESYLELKQSLYIEDPRYFNLNFNETRSVKKGIRKVLSKQDDTKIGYYLSDYEKGILNINLNLKYSPNSEDVSTKIMSALLQSLEMSGSSKGLITIENSKIDNWYLHEFYPKSEVSVYNINPTATNSNSKIEFHKSNLDNVWFDNVNFDRYKIISFYRTKFGKTVFTSCNFPNDYIDFETFKTLENIHFPKKVTKNFYKDQYEIFIQLKKTMEDSGNYYEALKFQAISNDTLKKIPGLQKHDKIILCINSYSNNHGLSLRRPIQYFFIFSIPLYILYLLSLNRIFNSNNLDLTLIGYYFSFVDLTHRSDFLVEKEQFNLFSLAIDYLNKIVVGFFIYQFIAAFRKYGKR